MEWEEYNPNKGSGGESEWEEFRPEKPGKYVVPKKARDYHQEMIDDMSFFDSMIVGTGREFSKVGTGIADLYDRAKVGVGYDEDNAIASMRARQKQQAAEDKLFGKLEDSRGGATMLGSMLPYIASLPVGIGTGIARNLLVKHGLKAAAPSTAHIAAKTGVKEGLTRYGKGLGLGVGEGAAQGAAHYDDNALAGAIFGAGGHVVGDWVGDFLGGTARRLQGDEPKIVKYGKDENIFVPPGMATGNKELQQVDQALKRHASSAEARDLKMTRSKHHANRKISQQMGGEDADIFTDDYISDQKELFQSDLSKLVKNTNPEFTPDMSVKATKLIERYRKRTSSQRTPTILKRFDHIIEDTATGTPMDGLQYDEYTSELRDAALDAAGSGKKSLATTLNDIAALFDDSIGEGLGGGALKDSWAQNKYNMKLITSIDKIKDAHDHVDPRKLSKLMPGNYDIDMLKKLEKLRATQSAASLGASSMIGRMLNPMKPSGVVGGALGLLAQRDSSMLNKAGIGIYDFGYPHVTGWAPVLGRQYTEGTIRSGVPRSLLAKDSGDDKEKRLRRMEKMRHLRAVRNQFPPGY